MSNPVQRMPIVSPTWATDVGTTLEPTLSERKTGWPENFKPPARWQNDYQRKVFQFCDIMQETLIKDWREGARHVPNTTAAINALGWHDSVFASSGHYLIEANGDILGSLDGRQWSKWVTSPLGGIANTIASNGSRIVIASGVGAQASFFSDNNGSSWAAVTGLGGIAAVHYMPQADIWIGGDSDASSATVSTDGETYVDAGTSAFYGGSYRNSENSDGTLVLLSNVYSTDQGSSWSAQTAFVGSGYIYSALRGEFIMWRNTGGDIELFEMSSTDGTWEATPFVDISSSAATAAMIAMFEFRGMLFGVVKASYQAGTDEQLELWVSRNSGGAWEPAAVLGGTDAQSLTWAVQPREGDTAGISSEYIVILRPGSTRLVCPAFAGIDFAAVLAP